MSGTNGFGSTYRLQFSKDLTFSQATGLVPYLDALGVGALYASPLLESGRGSNHGYDVVDPSRVSEERGGEKDRRALVAALRAAGLGLLLDIVPNHLGVEVAEDNPWWWDVLARGRESAYAGHFDIDFDAGPLLLPILGDDEQQALGELTLSDDGSRLRYYEHSFPVAGGTGGGDAAEVHSRQHYRLVSWRRGAAELNYRRFFDVSTLAAVRVEVPDVFDAAHREVLRWVSEGDVDGLRVDHPDGLSDPGGYLRRLRAAIGPDRTLLVEKILGVGEELPVSWPVEGTTGYEALREICGVFVDPSGEEPLDRLAVEHVGGHDPFDVAEHTARLEVARTILAAEVRRIAALVPGLEAPASTETDPDEAAQRVRAAVEQLLCGFPVYRSYLPEGRADLEHAFATARGHRPDLGDVLEVIRDEMLADPHGQLATRIQQTSGMVMAKGVEDTTFYRFNRMVALNEVGGDPSRFGVTPAEFHAAQATREAAWPHTMTTLSTHDTKRSEDVRARLAVLSEIPERWTEQLRGWTEAHPLPDRSLELLAWQNLIGAWPIDAGRFSAYLGKASKEAKLVTSHVDAVAEVDARIAEWPGQVLADADTVGRIERLVAEIEAPGWSNSLGQKLLQLAGPGVPDVYQGTERFEYSLVDPDNRRPIDWGALGDMVRRLDDGWLPEIDSEGAAKVLVTATALRLRRASPHLFSGYRPVPAQGPAAEHVIAFARSRDLVAVATRLPVGLAEKGGWADTVLPLPADHTDRHGGWYDVLTNIPVDGGSPRLDQLLIRYPVALLVRTP
ncbi:MAG TPA: malto-oligosyltrehalose synthase [Pseudonocardia sp.]|nr:malto-oligosyltrehalose synthase [Pseudonocardia sp.]